MIIKSRSLFIIVIIFSQSLIAQSYNWFPSEINIQPFTANLLEAKAGFLISTDNNKLRLDISTTRDIIHWDSDNYTISIGADVFTFTRLRSNDHFKFPVETIDYLFGLNAGYKKQIDSENQIGLRFRLSHISTHLVDGQYDAQTQKWRDSRDPFVYSKEFIELFPYYRYKTIRMYLGFTYIFHIIPSELKKINLQFGFDYFAEEIGTELFTPFIAYDFKLNGIEKFIGNNIISVGIKFGNWQSGGLSFYYSYIAGSSIHGQLYDLRENYSNIGFNFEL
ncbi:MAG: DUF1207 domain-containing protein [Ignavibacteriota bacterium]|nr:DUF1207 domain-containing protein [Ignavibacterium sp.]QKJ98869.1 MAG: DUF1207 domain-containing protein [Ignavibacteriota bacterium]HMN18607.1 DUF1207 domain-containing protein [Ignavibacteriaceae bacterium]